MKIAVRMGHQRTGSDLAAVGEYDVIRQYAPYVISGLQKLGHEILDVTPPENSRSLSDSLMYGINKANSWGADLFISCHGNSFNGTARGCEVVYYPTSTKGKELSTNICNELSKLGFKNRGAKADERGLAELKSTNMTAVIVEPLFVDSSDMSLFNGEKVGYAIVKGITGQDVIRNSIQTIDSKAFRVITGAFSNKQDAINFADKLKSNGTTVYVVDANILK